MNYPVFWRDIPEKTLDNFRLYCGYDFNNGGMKFSDYERVANVELKWFHAYRKSNEYVFESEAHYQWFLMRFS